MVRFKGFLIMISMICNGYFFYASLILMHAVVTKIFALRSKRKKGLGFFVRSL